MLRAEKNQMRQWGTIIQPVNQIGRPHTLIAAEWPGGNFRQRSDWGRTHELSPLNPTLSEQLNDEAIVCDSLNHAWKNTNDVKRNYTWAGIISSDRIVFDILTNRYRLVTAVDFEKGILWIKWIGTHKEYDKIDVKRVKHGRR
jgi:mRNA-degrading endonuclease HigB of HigAB toxin-antitoxin module